MDEFNTLESDFEQARLDYSTAETAYKIANKDEVAKQEAAAFELVLAQRAVDETNREDAVGALMT